jgi:hypothetical protein
MAVVTVKSGAITNRDASPRVLTNAAIAAGMWRGFLATVEAANGDSIGSKYIVGSVPSNAYGEIIKLYCDAITSGAADIGIYRTTADGGAVVDVDFYASAQSIASAIATGTEVQHEADPGDAGAGYGLADLEKPLWQRLGLTSDPKVMYDVVLTLTAATTAAGTIAVRGMYLI